MSIKAIAGVYALLAVASISHWVYTVLYLGTWGNSDLIVALVLLALAHGLVTFRPWARTLGLVLSGLFGVTGVLSLIVWVANLLGAFKGAPATGLIIERPAPG